MRRDKKEGRGKLEKGREVLQEKAEKGEKCKGYDERQADEGK